MAGQKITKTERLAFGGFVVALTALFFVIDQPRYGWFTVLAILLPYLAFVAPFRCGEPVRRDNSPCRNAGYGVLIGCHTHRLYKVQRIFGRRSQTSGARPRRARQPSALPAAPATPPSIALDGRPRPVGAALLVWGHHLSSGWWAAGIAFPFQKYRGSALRVLLTVWVPGEDVEARPGQSYAEVPRITLTGPVAAWPTLPPVYPGIGPEWRSVHLHVHRPDPEGEYRDVREAMRNLPKRGRA
jgi:hypothetical protein